jgi:hypothetical protein
MSAFNDVSWERISALESGELVAGKDRLKGMAGLS